LYTLEEGGCTDEVRPWIQGFVKLFGAQRSRNLLKGAGLPDDFVNNDTQTWKYDKASGLYNLP
jgi:hypothetical protein